MLGFFLDISAPFSQALLFTRGGSDFWQQMNEVDPVSEKSHEGRKPREQEHLSEAEEKEETKPEENRANSSGGPGTNVFYSPISRQWKVSGRIWASVLSVTVRLVQ